MNYLFSVLYFNWNKFLMKWSNQMLSDSCFLSLPKKSTLKKHGISPFFIFLLLPFFHKSGGYAKLSLQCRFCTAPPINELSVMPCGQLCDFLCIICWLHFALHYAGGVLSCSDYAWWLSQLFSAPQCLYFFLKCESYTYSYLWSVIC